MKYVTKAAMLCFLSALAVNANAALVAVGGQPVVGDQLLVGGMLATDTGALDTATTVQLSTVDGTGSTGGFGDIFLLTGNGGGTASLTSFSPVLGFMSIDGWTLDLSTLSVVTQAAGDLTLEGTGVLFNSGSGIGISNVADLYDARWAFSAQSASSYSLDVTVVPVPAAVWLFGSGLIGLVGLARRKA